MQSKAATVEEYLKELPKDRREVVSKLRKEIKSNLPKGFKEVMGYGMIGYVVPHERYPEGYHCHPDQPLPFMNLASQKNFIAVYHMGMYADKKLMDWFTKEYTKRGIGKLNMGKSCIRFTKPDKIPYTLIGELSSRITPDEWITYYERAISSRKK